MNNTSKPPVTDWLIHTALGNFLHTKLISWSIAPMTESCFLLIDYLLVISFLYESGAILGRAMVSSKKFNIFKAMLSTKDSDEFWQKMANERLKRFIKRFKKEPETFKEFIFERLAHIATGVHPYDAWERETFEKNYDVNKKHRIKVFDIYDKKIPLDTSIRSTSNPTLPRRKELQDEIRWYVREGIGFGSYFIELTEKMNNNFWESVRSDMDRLSERFPNASEITILSLEEQERALMKMVAFWAHECYQELLKPLALKQYIYKSSIDNFRLQDEYINWLNIYRNSTNIDLVYCIP
ncbi:MAG TPA: hypothetical protein VJ377_03005 [Dehalococcoidales bacterium]|nr:hypothetical protein [Dehalococcoidales bacterium]